MCRYTHITFVFHCVNAVRDSYITKIHTHNLIMLLVVCREHKTPGCGLNSTSTLQLLEGHNFPCQIWRHAASVPHFTSMNTNWYFLHDVKAQNDTQAWMKAV